MWLRASGRPRAKVSIEILGIHKIRMRLFMGRENQNRVVKTDFLSASTPPQKDKSITELCYRCTGPSVHRTPGTAEPGSVPHARRVCRQCQRRGRVSGPSAQRIRDGGLSAGRNVPSRGSKIVLLLSSLDYKTMVANFFSNQIPMWSALL